MNHVEEEPAMPFAYRLPPSESFGFRAAFAALPDRQPRAALRAWRSFWCRVDPQLIEEFSYRAGRWNDPPAVVRVQHHQGCWPWPGSTEPDGKGRVRIGNVMCAPQRAAVALSLGHPLDGGYRWAGGSVLCEDASCCNPWHLMAVPPPPESERSWRGGRDLGPGAWRVPDARRRATVGPRQYVGHLATVEGAEAVAAWLGLPVDLVGELEALARESQSRRGRGTWTRDVARRAGLVDDEDDEHDEFMRDMRAEQARRERR